MCQNELTEFLSELSEFGAELSEFSLSLSLYLSRTLSKQYHYTRMISLTEL